MNTREQIVQEADRLIRTVGYNAFSFQDISRTIGIKTASIHYHFPSKSDLGAAVVDRHIELVEAFIRNQEGKPEPEQIHAFIGIYENLLPTNRVCMVGSLGADFITLDPAVQAKLRLFSDLILNWLTGVLENGQQTGSLRISVHPRSKALMIITNLMGGLQLVRLFSPEVLADIKTGILTELIDS